MKKCILNIYTTSTWGGTYTEFACKGGPKKKPKREENVAEKIACEMENETLKIQRLHINIICRPSSRNPNWPQLSSLCITLPFFLSFLVWTDNRKTASAAAKVCKVHYNFYVAYAKGPPEDEFLFVHGVLYFVYPVEEGERRVC